MWFDIVAVRRSDKRCPIHMNSISNRRTLGEPSAWMHSDDSTILPCSIPVGWVELSETHRLRSVRWVSRCSPHPTAPTHDRIPTPRSKFSMILRSPDMWRGATNFSATQSVCILLSHCNVWNNSFSSVDAVCRQMLHTCRGILLRERQ
jgi:hypothetical protein